MSKEDRAEEALDFSKKVEELAREYKVGYFQMSYRFPDARAVSWDYVNTDVNVTYDDLKCVCADSITLVNKSLMVLNFDQKGSKNESK